MSSNNIQEISNGKYKVGDILFEVPSERYELISLLGYGSFGSVVKAYDKKLKKEVAIKKIIEIFSDPMDTKRVVRELKLLRHFNDSNNLTKLYEILEPSQKKFQRHLFFYGAF
eukprot:TRINITY_DN3952_c0_g1_i3.p1 TRINITY_DN3952_c0_g1~~TRINITY_DN3952_c0_g1_i3.p1  ORF type:complete len:113 (+),score=18.02 TRINITY_DN3952_c0_g1_i3:10-348(+)